MNNLRTSLTQPVFVAAVLATLLLPARQAEAALPIGFDAALGLGVNGAIDLQSPALDLRARAELRIGPLAIGAGFRGLPAFISTELPHRTLIYGHIGLNIPLPKARIVLRAGAGGGTDSDQSRLFGLHEIVGLHLFPKKIIGIGFEADFDQSLDLDRSKWNRGISGLVLLLFRL
ncbi:MAG: hypothetical protein CMP23_02725 [Rickettsiales bacterium]|nr:hypothetical protein [Rickettsiales bacterium]|tara:strand:+ start:948 stop:1469 length:522 start_codon:yes stop_codon:yes gene_type:complete